MTRFGRQRWRGGAVLALFLLGTGFACRAVARGEPMPRLPYLTGWVLFLMMLFLASYNLRKKLPFLPLGTSEGWLQRHVYIGWATLLVFVLHVGGRWPGGWFEGTLAGLYAVVFLSGVAGLALTRTYPRRLTTRGGEVIYERIPALRRLLREQAETLALNAVADIGSATVPDFYVRLLKDFFEARPRWWRQIAGDRRALNQLLGEMGDLQRYLNPRELQTWRKMEELVRQKDGLDYHDAAQFLLKGWLFVHVPFTYSLLLFIVAHIVLVYAFSGGAR